MTAEQAISWLTLKPKDLPVFVLIATDPFAPVAIDRWIDETTRAEIAPKKLVDAEKVVKAFRDWPLKKLPD
jgi:hypothetical protein